VCGALALVACAACGGSEQSSSETSPQPSPRVATPPPGAVIADSVTPSGPVFVTGLAAEGGRLWVADTVNGVLVRLG
jgi:hypothetical protein